MYKNFFFINREVIKFCFCTLSAFLFAVHLMVFAKPLDITIKKNINSKTGFAFGMPYFQTLNGAVGDAVKLTEVITQDKFGYLWFGTRYGLVRYDGYHAKTYQHFLEDKKSLAGAWVTALWSAPDGKLWVGTKSSGLSIYDPQTDRFENFYHDDGDKQLSSNSITSIVGDQNGNVWIGTLNGLDYWSMDRRVIQHWFNHSTNPSDQLGSNILSLYLDKGNLWIGSAEGLQRFNLSDQKFSPPSFFSQDKKKIKCQNIRVIFGDRSGHIWIGFSAGWGLIDKDQNGSDRIKIIRPGVIADHSSIAQPAVDEVWLPENDRIIVAAPDDGHIIKEIKFTPQQYAGLAGLYIQAAYVDFSGRLWLSAGSQVQSTDIKDHAFSVLYRNANPKFKIDKDEFWGVNEIASSTMKCN